jgi:Zn-dependent peptidase ImmA (M78 family)
LISRAESTRACACGGDQRVIQLATGQARVRQRFSLAHEIGHHLLGHRHGESELAERQANIFAGALLVPPTWLRRDVTSGMTAEALATRYDVSREVIFIALKDARLLKKLR